MIIPEDKLNALIQGYEDLYKSNEKLKKYAETDLPKRIEYVKEKYKEVVRDYNDLVSKSNRNIEKIEDLEKENKSLKNEIKGIYKGFNQFMENTLGATVGQAKKLMNNLVSEIKEFVKGGEFEKIHRNDQTHCVCGCGQSPRSYCFRNWEINWGEILKKSTNFWGALRHPPCVHCPLSK